MRLMLKQWEGAAVGSKEAVAVVEAATVEVPAVEEAMARLVIVEGGVEEAEEAEAEAEGEGADLQQPRLGADASRAPPAQ